MPDHNRDGSVRRSVGPESDHPEAGRVDRAERGGLSTSPDGSGADGANGESARRGSRHYTPQEKLAHLEALKSSDESVRAFAARVGVNVNTLLRWRRDYDARGLAGLEPRPNPRNSRGTTRRRYTPEERRQAIEAYLKSERSLKDFCALWGVGASSLGKWLHAYRSAGPKALEPKKPGPKDPPVGRARLPEPVKAAIVEAKRQHPLYGLRRVRDFLYRFHGLKVSQGGVRSALRDAGVAPEPSPKKKPRRTPKPPRRFERARPGQLWQSDITSFVLTRHSQRVYLTVFMDDHSRYVVAWGLHLHQKQDIVIEALLEGIARFGKPQEVLTDQGRQYYAWRGKSAFQKLLVREGITHVVSRAHHPQTLGKCERFWKTVGTEFWERVQPQDLADARERLGHFIAHYNHFRTHQGVGGLVPADRFFGATDTVRDAIERELKRNQLDLALGQPLRKSVFLTGRVGDQQLSLHGESGRLVIRTPDGATQRLELSDLGVEGRADANPKHEPESNDDPDGAQRTHAPAAAESHGRSRQIVDAERRVGVVAEVATATPDGEEAGGVPAAGELPSWREGAVEGSDRGGAQSGAPDERDDAGVLAGSDPEGGGRAATRSAAAARVADVSDGGRRHAGGAPATAADKAEGRADDGRQERACSTPEGDREAPPREGARGILDRALAFVSRARGRSHGEPGERRHGFEVGNEVEENESDPAEEGRSSGADRPSAGSGGSASADVIDSASPEHRT